MKQMWSRTSFPLVRRRVLWAVMCPVTVLAAACGSSGPDGTYGSASPAASATAAPTVTSPASPATGASAAKIIIAGHSFGAPVTVPPGAHISVTNKDSAEHSVTSDTAGVFDVDIAGNADASFTAPTEPGSYPFHCTYHPSMHGTLIVQ
jgi:plastocyanin